MTDPITKSYKIDITTTGEEFAHPDDVLANLIETVERGTIGVTIEEVE